MRILLVEDNADHRELMRLSLTGHDPTWQIEEVASGEEALRRVSEKQAFDLVFLDYSLPKRDGLEVLEEILRGEASPPVVMVTGRGSEQVAVRAMKTGAYDYVVKGKGYLQQLPVIAQRAVDRKRVEEALRTSEKKYSALVENSPDIIYVLHPEGNFSFVGGAVKSLLGFTSMDLIGKHFTSIVWPEDVEKARWHFNERRTGKRATRTLGLRLATKQRKGKSFDIRYLAIELNAFGMYDKPVSAKDKEFLGTYGVARDITERKRTEEALKRSREKLLEEYEQRKLLSRRLIDLLERDHHQVSMELHDQIGQTLTTLKMDLEMIQAKQKPTDTALRDLIRAAKDKVAQAIGQVKDIAYGLSPYILDTLGLIPSLRALVNEMKQSTDIGIHFFTRNVPERFDRQKELAIYRVVQEALTNIVKHAQAKKVFINLVKKGEALSLTVEDDGVGFEQKKVMKISEVKGPLGLHIMQERVVQLGGELSIESQVGKGTHLLAGIPL
jgi:PAS domain S-box-containing protein